MIYYIKSSYQSAYLLYTMARISRFLMQDSGIIIQTFPLVGRKKEKKKNSLSSIIIQIFDQLKLQDIEKKD